MGTQEIATALHRLHSLLERHPAMGLHDDAPATSQWTGGTRVVTRHADGTEIATDVPAELGGTDTTFSPSWLARASLAACATTCIALRAAQEGIELGALEVHVSSRSDVRGIFGMAGDDGQAVRPAPSGYVLAVHITAPGVSAGRLRGLVDAACSCSPVASALRDTAALSLQVDVRTDGTAAA